MNLNYEFAHNWFNNAAKPTWDVLIPKIMPKRILEIGSHDGASACYLIEKIGSLISMEIHCVDTWEGGLEHKADGVAPEDMAATYKRFISNTNIAKSRIGHPVELIIHKKFSHMALSNLISNGKESYFDFIYVDGSHQAPDVLCDALLAFRLLKQGGIMAFDDYLWHENLPNGVDPIRCPKTAIDAFTTIYCRQLKILSAPLYQLYIQKN